MANGVGTERRAKSGRLHVSAILRPTLSAILVAMLATLVSGQLIGSSTAGASTCAHNHWGGERTLYHTYAGISGWIDRDTAPLGNYTTDHFIAYLDVNAQTHDCVLRTGLRTCHLQTGFGYGAVGTSGKTTTIKMYREKWTPYKYTAKWFTFPVRFNSYVEVYWTGTTRTILWTGSYHAFGKFITYEANATTVPENLGTAWLNNYRHAYITARDEFHAAACPTLNHNDKFGSNGFTTYGSGYYLDYLNGTRVWKPFPTSSSTFNTTLTPYGPVYTFHNLNSYRAFYVAG